MKKKFTKLFLVQSVLWISINALHAQNIISINDAEVAPCEKNNGNIIPQENQAMWSVLFNYDLLASTSSNGNAGVCFLNNQFWVSRWANDSILILDITGAVVQRLTVPGVTGIRSFTTDGTYIYAGINTNSIKKIDPVTKTLVSSITAPIASVRSLTYDATVAGGGFWASTWGTDITQFDMSGNILNLVAASSHGLTGMYGTAFDNASVGGPYLWVFDQATSVNQSDIVQVNIATQLQTGVFHDVMSDVGLSAADTSGLAGGTFFYIQAPILSVIGVMQGSPTNRLFGYEVGLVTGVEENINPDEFINIFPNPVHDMVNINVNKQNNDEVQLQIFDAMGRIVFNKNTRGQNNYINFSKHQAGLYFVKTTYNGKTATSKFIKQ